MSFAVRSSCSLALVRYRSAIVGSVGSPARAPSVSRADLHSTRMIACGVTQIQSTLFTSFLPSLYVISP